MFVCRNSHRVLFQQLEVVCCATRSRRPWPQSRQAHPTSRYSRRDDGQRGAGCFLGTPKQRKCTIDRRHSSYFTAPTFLLISYPLSALSIDPKSFLQVFHVLRIPLRNTFAYFVVRIGLLFNRPEKYGRSLSFSYHDLLRSGVRGFRVSSASGGWLSHMNVDTKTRFYRDTECSLDEPSGKVRVDNSKVQNTHKENMQLRVLALGTRVVRQGSGREKATAEGYSKTHFSKVRQWKP